MKHTTQVNLSEFHVTIGEAIRLSSGYQSWMFPAQLSLFSADPSHVDLLRLLCRIRIQNTTGRREKLLFNFYFIAFSSYKFKNYGL